MPYLLLIVLLLTAAGCGGPDPKASGPASSAQKAAPRTYQTVAPVEREVTDGIEATGSLAAMESSDVVADVEGTVDQAFVEAGQFVAMGAPLVKLRSSMWKLQWDQASAAERQAAAALEQARQRVAGGKTEIQQLPDVMAAKASADGAEAELRAARAENERTEKLLASGDVSRSEFERALASYRGAEARALAARQQYQAALNTARQDVAMVAAAESQLEAAKSATAMRAKQMEDTVVRAPFAGYVSARHVGPGEYVGAGVKVATLERVEPMRVLLQAAETALPRLRTGMRAQIRAAALPDAVFEGALAVIHPVVQTSSRALTLEVRAANPGHALKPGMFVTAVIEGGAARKARFLPQSAVTKDASTDATIAWTVVNGAAKLNALRTGRVESGQIEVLSGLDGSARVIENPSADLFDGALVSVK
jgi:RND family efflux transporter MFP subunit